MKKVKRLFLLFLITLLIASFNFAQDKSDFTTKLGGTIQFWGSYGEINSADTNSLGFGIRRARLKVHSTLGNKVKGYIQVEVSSPKLVDARIEYLISDAFTIRAGRFVGASIRGGSLTSHTEIDITERPLTAVKWASLTVGSDYRDYGVDFAASLGDITANVTFHNGNGSENITNRQSKNADANISLAISAMLAFKPKSVKGLEAGGYYGHGNPTYNEYNSYNAYIYYEPMPIRLKAEIISWTNLGGINNISQLGYYLFAGYRIANNWEAVARFENYDPNIDLKKNEQRLITIGATYAVFSDEWKAAKITAAYTFINESGSEINNNVAQIVMQLAF